MNVVNASGLILVHLEGAWIKRLKIHSLRGTLSGLNVSSNGSFCSQWL